MEGNWKKKLLSMFLVLALCLSMIPTSALAEEAAGGSAAVGQEELTTGDPAGAEGGSAGAVSDPADATGGSAGAVSDPAGATDETGENEGNSGDQENGANGENGASTNGEPQTPDNDGDENAGVNGGNDAEINGENGTVENGDENDADPQAGEEAENGIALLAGEETVSGMYITGVSKYVSDKSREEYGFPQSYKYMYDVECTELTADWLANNRYTLDAGWYVVQNSIGVYNTLTINGTVHLIMGSLPYGLQIYYGSIHLTDGSTLNIYGEEAPDGVGSLGISEPTTDAFTCDGSAAIHVYGGGINATVKSGATVLQSGISLSIEPQRELKISAKDSTGTEISVSDRSNPTSDLSNATEMLIGACEHTKDSLQSKPSSATGHQQVCPDCGFVAFGVNHEEVHNWENGKCTVCNYECLHENLDANGACTVCGATFAAQNTTTGKRYSSLKEALEAATDGQTVILLNDQSMESNVVLKGGVTVTLDLNGKTNQGNGMINVGYSNNNSFNTGEYELATLKLVGEGSLLQSYPRYASISVYPGSTLDLSGWEGGEITYVTVGGNSNSTKGDGAITGSISEKVKIGTLSLNNLWNTLKVTLNGGSYGVIQISNSQDIYAKSILPKDYVFRNADGTFVPYEQKINDSNISNVTVVKCSAHQDTDGDKICDYCNTDISSAAAKVTTTENKTYYFMAEQDASGAATIDASVASATDTVTLLTSDLTINNANCKIDLNDKTVKKITASGSDLVVEGSGTVALLDTTSGSAKLNGGTYKDISTASNTTLGSLLPDGYGFKKTDSSSSWLTEEELAKCGSNVLSGIGNVTVAKAPFESLSLNAPESITYTEDLTITAKVDTTGTVTYKWYEDNKELTDKTAATLTLKDAPRNGSYTKNPDPAEYGNAGDHTFKCVASSDGYVVSKEVTVTVKQADLTNARLTISGEDNLAYVPFSSNKDSGEELNVAYDLWYNNKYLTVQSSNPAVEPIPASDYIVTGNKGVIDAGIHTLTITGQGNYTGTKSIQFVVKPCELSDRTSISNLIKEYDGTTDLPLEQLDSVGFVYEGRGNTIYFDRGEDYTVEGAQFENADVGAEKTVIIKFRMLNPNYSFAGGQREIEIVRRQQDAGSATQEIEKAAATDQSVNLKVMNGHAKTYTVDLAKLIPELAAPKKYGDITYGQPLVQLATSYYVVGGAKVENGVLTLPIEQVDTDVEGKIGTVKVVVSTTNYKDMTLTVNVMSTNKLIPTGEPTLSKAALTYGEKLGDITLSGSMKYEDATVEGTFAWVNPDAKPDATTAYTAEWIFTPTDGATYAEVSGKTEIAVNKATPAGEPVYTKITAAGKTVTAAALAVNPNWPAGTVKWVDADGKQLDDSTEVKVNTAYQWLFTPTDTNNYNTATGTIVLYTVSSSGGGSTGGGAAGGDTSGGGSSAIAVPVSSGNGDTSISATVEGTTATIAADGEQIDKVISDGAKSVEIDVSGLSDVDTVKLPTDIISKANEAKSTTLTIKLADGAVELSQKALKTIASGEEVTISIQQATLTDAQRQAVGSLAQVAAVVDVNLYVGGKQQSRFGGGALTISIPYTPKAGEDTSKLAVWFIRDDGTIETKNGTYDAESGCFVFKTKHLSQYLLVDTTKVRTATDTSAKIGVWTQVVMFFRKFLGK